MARSTSKGLFVFDLGGDNFSHTQAASNLDLIDSYWIGFDSTTKLPKRLHTTTTVPGSGTAGDVVMLSAADGGFSAWTLIRYNGSTWRAIGYEILPTVPSAGNYAGRIVVLSAADSGFQAWDVIRYDGSLWGIVGGWSQVNAGGVVGLATTKDIYISDSSFGVVMVDRVSGTKYRLFFRNGTLNQEIVT